MHNTTCAPSVWHSLGHISVAGNTVLVANYWRAFAFKPTALSKHVSVTLQSPAAPAGSAALVMVAGSHRARVSGENIASLPIRADGSVGPAATGVDGGAADAPHADAAAAVVPCDDGRASPVPDSALEASLEALISVRFWG